MRVYNSDIESFSSAQEEGVGIRVITDGRQGFAYAGALELDVLEDTLAEARDNATFAEYDEFVALAEPDGVPFADIDLFHPASLQVPTDQKIELAFELEKKLLGADSRITTVPMAIYGDEWSEVALATSTGIAMWQQGNDCALSTYCLAVDNGDTQTGFGVSVAREFDQLDLEKAVADAAKRATQLLGATKPKSRRLPVILDPYVTAAVPRRHRVPAHRRGCAEGAIGVRRSRRRTGRRALRSPWCLTPPTLVLWPRTRWTARDSPAAAYL